MPGRHPDDDQLADLAADVLPVDQARAVEAHVLACDRCASLLSDAERVRGLLLADDAGPVPPEIWSRIEAALQAASPTSTSPTSSSPSVLGERAPTPPPPAPVEQRVDSAGPGRWDGPDPLDNPDDWTTAARPVAASRSRSGPGIPTGGVRRLSTPRREARPERRRRPAPLLLVAAAAVVLAMAVGAVRLVRSGGDATAALQGRSSAGTGSGSAAAGAADAAAGAELTRSNREYTSSTLATGARSLVAALGRGQAGTVTAEGSSTADAARPPAPRAATSLPSVTPDPAATDVTNPQRLAACLAALGASPDSAVAVDLARYQGREAAVLVVRTASGYEVWVVERTCHPGDEGALAETTLAG
jgi:hypothetical protein